MSLWAGSFSKDAAADLPSILHSNAKPSSPPERFTPVILAIPLSLHLTTPSVRVFDILGRKLGETYNKTNTGADGTPTTTNLIKIKNKLNN